MKLNQYYSHLCKPAKFYFILSVIIYLIVFIQNITTPGKFSLGFYTCDHKQTPMILIYHAFYILLWTFILNLICRGSTTLSWVIVLFPFILSIFILAYIMFLGMTSKSCNCGSSCTCNKSPDKGHTTQSSQSMYGGYHPIDVDMYSVSYSEYGSPY
jgi:hypothetical protein